MNRIMERATKVNEFDFAVAILGILVAALNSNKQENHWIQSLSDQDQDLLGESAQSARAYGEDNEVTESFTYLGSVGHDLAARPETP